MNQLTIGHCDGLSGSSKFFIVNALWTNSNNVGTAYLTNPLNQYTNILRDFVPSCELNYDPDGNLTDDGTFTYTWDGENRLIAAYSGGALVISNAYDHQSRRVLKVTPDETRTFLYDGWNLNQETIATSTSITTNHYIWGKDLSGTLQGAGGVGGLLAVIQGRDGSPSRPFFPLYDNNGNITAYVDESGIIVAEYAYDAFGNTISQNGPLADFFPHRFSTKYYDPETSLYYYGYRFYSPALMRWLNRDYIEEEGGNNLYGFCGNDGNNNYDFAGLSWMVTRRMHGPGSQMFNSQGDTVALAEWKSSVIPDFDLLAVNIGLDAEEVLQWARKDAGGTHFSSRGELERSCKFYIPNRILVIAHDADHFRYRLKRPFSRRLNRWGERMADHYSALRGYAQLHYRYSYEQGVPTDGDRQISQKDILWPTAGFVMTGHGKKGLLPEQQDEKGASVMYGDGDDAYQITPLNFMGPRGYKFSFVYVASCYAGTQPWKDLASRHADLFVSPGWRAESELSLPTHPNPPRW